MKGILFQCSLCGLKFSEEKYDTILLDISMPDFEKPDFSQVI